MTELDSRPGAAGADPVEPADIDAHITDADVARARAQIGIPVPAKDRPWVRAPDASSIAHFGWGYGDDNPLYQDGGYGETTRWRSQIAPPLYLIATGIDETPPLSPELKPLFKGLFPGVGKYYSGVEWEWYRPVYPGDLILRETCTSDVTERQSSFSQGRVVVETYQTLYVNRSGEPIAVRRESYVNAERRGSRDAGKYTGVERATWTPEALAAVDARYAEEQRRGAEPRYWEHVGEAEALQTIAKGPLTTTDIISMHMAMGWGGYGQGPLRLGWRHRSKMAAFYTPDEWGVPQVVQRLHWDDRRARDLGLPAPYDYGQMRTCWLSQVVTNWMGDDGWLWKLTCEARRFNFHGDVQFCSGTVSARRREGPLRVVEVELAATNQRDEVTTPGTASVILPSVDGGSARLPPPPDELAERGARLAAESAARRRV
ncbi:MAG: FAS1-like dehydratase domain-containing protein [Acidimicrobiales bacterium]